MKFLDRRFFSGAVIGLVVGVAGSAIGGKCAFNAFMNPERRINWITERVTRELNLNDSQKTALSGIKTDVLARLREMKSFHERVPGEIIDQIGSEKVDEAQMNRFFDEETGHIVDTRKFLIRKFAEFHATLTPEQRAKLEKEAREYFEKHRRWRE